MEKSPTSDITLREQLNRQLNALSHVSKYCYVKAIVIYWQDENQGFRKEAEDLRQFLENNLGYPTEEFAIPSSESHLCLDGYISRLLLGANESVKEKQAPGLLIIHYGGHGDRNDDRHKGEERRSVWAAFSQGGPTLQWYDIQPKLGNSTCDVLLILDCCYGAQAGRAQSEPPSTVELLAAAAMGMRTPEPGPGSFTVGLMREMRACMLEKGYVTISELHFRLVAREAKLFATAVHIQLKHGPRERSIRLEPFVSTSHEMRLDNEQGSSLSVLIRLRERLEQIHISDLVQWLRTDVPPTVASLKIDKLLQATGRMRCAARDMAETDDSLSKVLDEPARDNIIEAWEHVVELVSLQMARRDRLAQKNDQMGVLQKGASEFLERLKEYNSAFADTVERSVLHSTKLSDAALESTIKDPAAEKLGMTDQLRLRRMIVFPSQLDLLGIPSVLSSDRKDQRHQVLQEYKYYGAVDYPEVIAESGRRVEQLAVLLSQSKHSSFCSLRCSHWYHEPSERRFVIEFDIPPEYETGEGHYTSLWKLISEGHRASRPSLGERFRMALTIAKAVQKWHSVGWVHQGISGPNIIFFSQHEAQKSEVDVSKPFLKGFDFARRGTAPSHGHYADDILSNVYRHPRRQGLWRDGHRKIHDIYSLGVVLLEIGLWQAAKDIITLRESREPTVSLTQEKLFKATERLAHYAGRAFQRAVSVCLQGDFGVEFDDSTESHLARAFQVKVIDELTPGVAVQ